MGLIEVNLECIGLNSSNLALDIGDVTMVAGLVGHRDVTEFSSYFRHNFRSDLLD